MNVLNNANVLHNIAISLRPIPLRIPAVHSLISRSPISTLRAVIYDELVCKSSPPHSLSTDESIMQPLQKRNTHIMAIAFLGTCSGGGPIDSRNCSSLVFDAQGDGSLWMVDCAEGTLRQFTLQPRSPERRWKTSSLNKVFITHMHADHIMGLITLLRHVLRPAWMANSSSSSPPVPSIEIYGPAGLRAFIRHALKATHTRTADYYCVHELLSAAADPPDTVTPCVLSACATPADAQPKEELFDMSVGQGAELPGRDIWADADGFWKDITNVGRKDKVRVDAGPIVHRAPCLGFVFRELALPRRKVVILGDTIDPKGMIPLIASTAPQTVERRAPVAEDPEDMRSATVRAMFPEGEDDEIVVVEASATAGTSAISAAATGLSGGVRLSTGEPEDDGVALLVHEATDASIPSSIDPQAKRTPELVQEKCIERGHSTPSMAGAFARSIGARRVVLNHVGSRFPLPTNYMGPRIQNMRRDVLDEIARQCDEARERPTAEELAGGVVPEVIGAVYQTVLAYDFFTVEIPPFEPPPALSVPVPGMTLGIPVTSLVVDPLIDLYGVPPPPLPGGLEVHPRGPHVYQKNKAGGGQGGGRGGGDGGGGRNGGRGGGPSWQQGGQQRGADAARYHGGYRAGQGEGSHGGHRSRHGEGHHGGHGGQERGRQEHHHHGRDGGTSERHEHAREPRDDRGRRPSQDDNAGRAEKKRRR